MAQVSFDDCEKLETEIQKRTVEQQQLQAQEASHTNTGLALVLILSQPPLKKFEDEYVQLMSDKTKFIAFIELHKQKAEKIKVGNGRARAAIADHGISWWSVLLRPR